MNSQDSSTPINDNIVTKAHCIHCNAKWYNYSDLDELDKQIVQHTNHFDGHIVQLRYGHVLMAYSQSSRRGISFIENLEEFDLVGL